MKVVDFIKKYGTVGLAQLLPVESLLGNGNIFFVNSAITGCTDTVAFEFGNGWETPFKTAQYALARCTASQGDIVLVGPGHTEAIAATDLDMAIAGVSLVGIGFGSLMPTFTFSAAGSTVLLAAAPNCRIKGVRFVAGTNDIASAITTDATSDGLIVENCEFNDAAASEILVGITLATGCDNVIIRGNRFQSVVTNTGVSSAIYTVGACNNVLIEDNIMYGPYAVAGIDNTAGACLNLTIRRNIINAAAATKAVVLHASTTGALVDNRMYATQATAANAVTAAGVLCAGNFTAGNYTLSGILAVPTADA
jgi:hypothetical protein